MKKITFSQCTFAGLLPGFLPLMLVIILPWNALMSQNPAVDLSFNGNGKRFYSDGSSKEVFEDMAVDAAGRILLAGYTDYDPDEGGRKRGVVMRLLNNGALDNSWGVNGIVYIDFPNSTDELYGIALDAAGSVYACGRTVSFSAGLYKLSGVNGALDPSFGTGGRVVMNSANTYKSIAITSNGKILVAGNAPFSSTNDNLFIAKYNSNGTLDASFGTNGSSLYGTNEDEYTHKMILQSDGKILVAGYQWTCSHDNCIDPIVMRVLPNGQLDSGFGIKVITFANWQAEAFGIATQTINGEEHILLSGYHEPSSDYIQGFIARLRNNGNYDTGFNNGSSGFLTLSNMAISRVTIQSDNKILLLSTVSYFQNGNFFTSIRIMRRNANGTLDTSFGNNGIFDHQVSTHRDDPATLLSVGNKIYVVGGSRPSANNFSDYDGFVSRYTNCSGGPNITTAVVNSKCGQANGQISAAASGGVTPFSYVWSNGQITPGIQNLAPGTYSVTVTTADGCSSVASATVNATPVVVASIVKTDAKCGLFNGSASVTISSGPGIQSYQWSTGATTASISNLPSGNYGVTITDVNGCVTTLSTSVGNTPLSAFNVNVVNTTCGLSNGTLNAVQTGGPSITSYQWSNGMSGANLSNLTAGIYTVTVSDVNSCTLTASRTIQSSPALILTLNGTGTSCGLNNGSATVSASISNASFLWSNGATGTSISNLAPGNYMVTATVNACTTAAPVIIPGSVAPGVSLTPINPSCGLSNGLVTTVPLQGVNIQHYQWSTGATTSAIQNLAPGTYSLTMTDINGCTAVQGATIFGNPVGDFQLHVTQPACGNNNGSLQVSSIGQVPISLYQWSTGAAGTVLQNLAPGTYTVTATDANGCTMVKSATLQPALTAVVTLAATATTCGFNNGAVCASVSGPIAIQSYIWSNGAGTSCIQNLASGVYSVTATDMNGCTQVLQASVAGSLPFAINLGPDIAIQSGQTAIINAETPGALSYQWSTGATTSSISVNMPGNYSVTVTNGAGCTDSDLVVVSMTTSAGSPVEEVRVKAYPNPVVQTLHVDYGTLKAHRLAVYDLSGRLQLEQTTLPEDQIIDLQVTELPAGNYFLQLWVKDQEKPVNLPFIKS